MDNLSSWLPIMGKIGMEEGNLVFKGAKNSFKNPISNEISEGSAFGLFLNQQKLTQGKISVDILITEQPILGTQFLIVFNFINNGLVKYHSIGINLSGSGNSGSFYAVTNDYKREHQIFFGSGIIIGEKFNISLEIRGSRLFYSVKGIQVFSSDLADPIISDRIGFYCSSDVDIVISDFYADAIKPKAFVIMKYDEIYDSLYSDVIKPICKEFNFNVMRADENYSTGIIINDIIDQIYEASLIIAEITPDNPNVFYELGYAHALNKPTILLCEKSQRQHLPFDVSGYRVIFYDNSINGKNEVERRLQKFLESMSISV